MKASGESGEAALEAAKVIDDSIPLEVAVPAVTTMRPGESFKQVWQFTNRSDTDWCKGVGLHLAEGGQMQAPTSVPVPDIAPGQTVIVPVAMVAPAEPGVYRGGWHLQSAGSHESVASGTFVFQNGCLAESEHPYDNNASETWEVTNPDTDAQNTRAHFSQVDMASGDYIILKDGTGTEYQRITGSYPSGLWSKPVPGRVVQVQLVTNASGTRWGFCLDQLETVHLVYLPLVPKQPTPTPSPTPTATPCGCHGYHCTCVPVHYWYPC